VPYQVKSKKVNHDVEFEWLLCLASRLQTSQRPRPAEIRGIKKPGEFPILTMTRSLVANPRGLAILDRRHANHKATKRTSLSP
jgi:hypothetical protein